MSEWIKCSERLPTSNFGYPYLVYAAGVRRYGVAYYEKSDNGIKYWIYPNGTPHSITHWMPLPPPPEDK